MKSNKRGRPKGKQLTSPDTIYKGRPCKVNKNGEIRKHGFFQKGSRTQLILRHLQNGGQLSQLDCYPPSKFNTIRLGGIIGELRDRGYSIKTKIVKNQSGSKHGVYYM